MLQEIGEGVRLSPQQKHVWKLQEAAEHMPYRVQCSVLVRGELSVRDLTQALQRVVQRHTIFRTSLRRPPWMTLPLQVIDDDCTLDVAEYHLDGLDAQEQEAQLERIIRQLAQLPFNVEQGPLIHAALVRRAPTTHVLLISMSALCGDTTTLKNLVGEVSHSYRAELEDSEADAATLQYHDICDVLHDILEAEDTAVGREYWYKQAIAEQLHLSLPGLRVRPTDAAAFSPACVPLALPPDVIASINAIVSRKESILHTFLLTCWYALLYRLAEQTDILVGVAYDGRTYEGMDQAMGLFTKYIPLIYRLDGAASFDATFTRVDQLVQEVYEWQDYFAWEQIIPSSRRGQGIPVPPFSFDFQEQPEDCHAGDVVFTIQRLEACLDRFKLKLSALQQDDTAISLNFYYDAALFYPADIERLAQQFYTLLLHVVAETETSIADLNIVSVLERQQLLTDFNRTARAYPEHSCFHQLFERQVDQTPNNAAISFGRQELTYAELNARANQLAHYLRRQGVGPETRIALGLARSPELLISILGILKAGAAYVPIDLFYPAERQTFFLHDSQAALLITHSHMRDRLPQHTLTTVTIDADWEIIGQEGTANPDPHAHPLGLAYILYTSGSTGRPKGAMITHRGLVNYVTWCKDAYAMAQGSGALVHSPVGFDLTVTSLLAPLVAGQRVYLLTEQQGVEALEASLRVGSDFSFIKLTPTHLDALNHLLPPEQVAGRTRALIIGGEALRDSSLALWRTHAPATRLINEYGPTETVVGCCVYEVSADHTPSSSVPIGRPIANTQLYVLDQCMRPVPTGVIGELYIGGAGLARGYLHRPDLTAERFVPNPFADQRPTTNDQRPTTRRQGDKETRRQGDDEPATQHSTLNTQNSRLYRTGDLARHLPDGNVEFLGRNDHQVKIRGFRVELGEIEAVLRECPAVREVAVIARDARDTPGDRRLIAYVVPSNDHRPPTNDQRPGDKETRGQGESKTEQSTIYNLQSTIPETLSSILYPLSSDLRAFLKDKLPDYMVPALFMVLEQLPLSPNGKVDRHALPTPNWNQLASAAPFVAPRAPIEQQLATIWAEVLRIERVGVHDSFFELGGDSILSLQIVAKASAAGIRLAPKHFFQHRTIAEMATVAGTVGVQAEQGLVEGPVPLTPIQHWFFEQNMADMQHWNQALLFEVQPLDTHLLEQALEQLLNHHDALRLRFDRTADSGWCQTNSGLSDLVPYSSIDLASLPASQQAAAITEVATRLQTSLDISNGPLLQCAYFDCGANRSGRVLLIIHHLVIDGVSWRVMLEDLQRVYQQLSRGEPATLPAKTTSFKHWAERLASYAQSEALAQELPAWLSRAHTRTSRLPQDKAFEDALAVANSRTLATSLSRAETHALLQEVPARYQTQINDALLTALAQAFAPWTASSALLVELEGHGREDLFDDLDISRTVGWCTTIFPVLIDLGPSSDPGAALGAIKEQLRCIPNNGIGYGLLRYLSQNPETTRQLEALPQAEVSFNYLGQFDQTAVGGWLTPANESIGMARSPRSTRRYLIEIDASLLNEQLHVNWTYSEQIHERTTIEQLARRFISALQSLTLHCQSLEVNGHVLAGLSDEALTNADLEAILNQINR